MRVEDHPDAGAGIDPEHDLIRLGGPVARTDEPHPGRVLEHQPQLGLRHRQPLAGADEERDARPAPVVDLEPERGERLGVRVGCDSGDLAVAGVLTADEMPAWRRAST